MRIFSAVVVPGFDHGGCTAAGALIQGFSADVARTETVYRVAYAVGQAPVGIAQGIRRQGFAAHSGAPVSGRQGASMRTGRSAGFDQRDAEQGAQQRLRLGIRVGGAQAQRPCGANGTARLDGARLHGEQWIVQALVGGIQHHI